LLTTHYGPEMWDLYQRGMLDPDVALTGHFVHQQGLPWMCAA
jgi:RIO kinase 1